MIETTPIQLTAGLLGLTALAVAITAARDAMARQRKRRQRGETKLPIGPLTRVKNAFKPTHRKEWLSLVGIVTATLIWTPLFVAVAWGLIEVITTLPDMLALARGSNPDPIPSRYSLLSLTALTATLGALVAFPFTVLRTWFNARQTVATEQGLITDRINKAVEGLGAEKTVKDDGKERTVPNIEVRIGAIYSLERIAQDSERDHIQIMEILCAYIRENAPADTAQDHGFGEWPPNTAELTILEYHQLAFKRFGRMPRGNDLEDGGIREWAWKLKAPRRDIQTVLDVLGRRSQTQRRKEQSTKIGKDDFFRLDLRNTNLQGADLSEKDFSFSKFNKSCLDGALMQDGIFNEAIFIKTSMQGAHCQRAYFIGTQLSVSNCERANFDRAVMDGSKLTFSRMVGCGFYDASMFQTDAAMAYFERSDFGNATLTDADFRSVDLKGALFNDLTRGPKILGCRTSRSIDQNVISGFMCLSLRNTDLSHTKLLDIRFLNDAIADFSVRMPSGFQHGEGDIASWKNESLGAIDFFKMERERHMEIGYSPPKS